MANKVNVNEIDERLIVSRVRRDQIKQEIVPPPLEPLTATVTETASETVTATTEPTNISVQPEVEKTVALPEPPKEENKRRRKSQDYETLFIKEVNITARLGKTVYIRKEFHDRILKITQVIGENEVSLFSYIDNIIAHHFDTFQDDIIRCYNSKNSNSIF
jgi:hypothetical protein